MNFKKITTTLALVLAVGTVPSAMAFSRNGKAEKQEKHSKMHDDDMDDDDDNDNDNRSMRRSDRSEQMDQNRDGAISRGEWRGDAARFDRLDTDHNQILTRGEIRGARDEWRGKKAKKNMRFAGLDRDNDGRITRDEWRGNDISFRNHDRNGDGVLSGSEVRTGKKRDDR